MPALAVGPDHDRPVLDCEVWQEDAPRERPCEEILTVRQSHHFKHVAGAFRGRRADVLAQDGRAPHATSTVKNLEITSQFIGHGDADVDPLDRQRFSAFVGEGDGQSLETVRLIRQTLRRIDRLVGLNLDRNIRPGQRDSKQQRSATEQARRD